MDILSETHRAFQNLSSNNHHFSWTMRMCLVISNRYFIELPIAETIECILEDFLVTMNSRKSLDLLDCNFTISTLEKYGLRILAHR